MRLNYLNLIFIFNIFSLTISGQEQEMQSKNNWEASFGTGIYDSALELGFGRSISKKSVLGADLGYFNWLDLKDDTNISFALYYKYHFKYNDFTQKKGNWYLAAYHNFQHWKYQDTWEFSVLVAICKYFALKENLKIYSCLGVTWDYLYIWKENEKYYTDNHTVEYSRKTYTNFVSISVLWLDAKLGIIYYF
jgi:hypothetical protein